MNKIKYILFFVLMLFISCNNINATCNENIKTAASKVNIDKKVITNIADDEIYFQIQISSLTNDMYVNVIENEDNTSKNYYYKDTKDGLLKINSYYLYDKIKWTAKIYSNNNECKRELLKTLSIETPKFNDYYSSNECKKLYVPKYCGFFADTSNINKEEFLKLMKEYEENLNATPMNKVLKFIINYYLYIIIPIIIIGSIYLIKIIKLKRSRKK